MSLYSSLKLTLFRSHYEKIFREKYVDLCKGISTMNYDVLEELCEPTLLTQLAGCVYQVSEIDNQAIHHINPDDQVSVRVVNHLYVQDQMSVD